MVQHSKATNKPSCQQQILMKAEGALYQRKQHGIKFTSAFLGDSTLSHKMITENERIQ